MLDDPAAKLVRNFNEYERIKKKLLLRMAVMTYLTKFHARNELKIPSPPEKEPKRQSQISSTKEEAKS